MAIILASASPRRQELLKQVNCTFSVIASSVAEDNDQHLPPFELVVSLARAKAVDVAKKVAAKDDIVIGADTIVELDGKVYGKPRGANDAYNMLNHLAGRTHQVVTGIAVMKNEMIWTDYVVTFVTLAELSSAEIKRYIATNEPLDKAGSYAIQGIGSLFVKKIEGCYFNVVGLPLNCLAEMLKKAGVSLL